MKELTLQEVLQIAGGIPPAAALDELAYGLQEEAVGEKGSASSNVLGAPPSSA